MDNKKRTIKINELENSTIEIETSIMPEELEKYKESAVKNLGSNIKIDGFRQGHIPENVLIQKIGEMPLLNEMTELALADIYPAIIVENKIKAIGRPQINITKIAPKNPVELKIIIAIMPEITLPDHKKIAQKINLEKKESIEVTEKELDDTITQIQKMNAEKTEITEDENGKKTSTEPKLPEITDEFVKKLGDFNDVEDFKNKIKENIKKEKENKAQEIKRVKIMDAILEKTKLVLPSVITENETERMLAQSKSDIERMGLQFDKYLEHIKKTEEEFKKEISPEAEKRAKIQLILDEIIKKEEIKADEEEVKKNVDALLKQHKDATEEQVKPYVEMVLSNQAVFKLLENQ